MGRQVVLRFDHCVWLLEARLQRLEQCATGRRWQMAQRGRDDEDASVAPRCYTRLC